jgi:hypothetical protein
MFDKAFIRKQAGYRSGFGKIILNSGSATLLFYFVRDSLLKVGTYKYTVKKENKIFLIYREMQMGLSTKSKEGLPNI